MLRLTHWNGFVPAKNIVSFTPERQYNLRLSVNAKFFLSGNDTYFYVNCLISILLNALAWLLSIIPSLLSCNSEVNAKETACDKILKSLFVSLPCITFILTI